MQNYTLLCRAKSRLPLLYMVVMRKSWLINYSVNLELDCRKKTLIPTSFFLNRTT